VVGELPALAAGRTRAGIDGGAMTLLRRAPREVYRVYSEDEFFAAATPDEDQGTVSHPNSAGHQLQRIAGVTILLAVVGAVGGMVAITSVSRVAGARRRGIGRLSAASGSPVRARGGVAPVHTGTAIRSHLGKLVGRSGVAAHLGGPSSRVRKAGKPFAGSGDGGRGRGRGSRGASRSRVEDVSGPTHVVQAADIGVRVSVADSWAGTSTSAPRPVQAEFGFER
jgi:hypothetical protein